MQIGAQANGLVKRAYGGSHGHPVAAHLPEPVADACPHPRQASPQAPSQPRRALADITVPRSEILINYSAIRK
jgi:hypothetical protein